MLITAGTTDAPSSPALPSSTPGTYCPQVCLSTVGTLGDVARNVESDLLPYCPEIMQLLIHNLGSNEVHRSIKPQVGNRMRNIPQHNAAQHS